MAVSRLLSRALRDALQRRLRAAGYQIVRVPDGGAELPPDIAADGAFLELYEQCRHFTMTSVERMYALYQAVRHVARHGIGGDLVECGVWKGGSAMLCALALREMGETARDLYLYDTYGGMAEPDERDVSYAGEAAREQWEQSRRGEVTDWCFSPLEEVRANLLGTGYPAERLHFVKGRVEDTIPATAPDRVALLRLDTDWYESTRHELEHLYPLVAPGGVVIIDDYGYWRGAREATDEYLDRTSEPLLLGRIDFTGRISVKPGR
jgi:O-methyltransferase